MRFLTNMPIVVALAATGCATLQTNGSTQRIPVTSTPPAAEVLLDGQAVGVTPVEVVVSRRAEHEIRIEKEGWRSSEQTLRRSTSWWLLADVGVGHFGHTLGVAAGAGPVLLDYLIGAAFRFQSRVDASLEPAGQRGGCVNHPPRWGHAAATGRAATCLPCAASLPQAASRYGEAPCPGRRRPRPQRARRTGREPWSLSSTSGSRSTPAVRATRSLWRCQGWSGGLVRRRARRTR